MHQKRTLCLLMALAMAIGAVLTPFSTWASQYYQSYYREHRQEAYSAILQDQCLNLADSTADGDAFLDKYVPQGVTAYGEYLLVSGYEKNEAKKQVILIFDKAGTQKGAVILNIKSHMGGITYGKNTIWIASTKKVLSFPSSYVDDAIRNGSAVVEESAVKASAETDYASMKEQMNLWERIRMFFAGQAKETNRYNCSYCTFYGDYLWVGSYSDAVAGELFAYQVDDNGTATTAEMMIDIPKYVQGVEFYNDDGQEYILMTGRSNALASTKYYISAYRFNRNVTKIREKENVKRLQMTSYIEEGAIDLSTGIYYQVFESGSSKYSGKKSTIVVDKVLAMKLSAILPIAGEPQTTTPATSAETTTTEKAPETTQPSAGNSTFMDKLCGKTWDVYNGNYRGAARYTLESMSFSKDGTAKVMVDSYHSKDEENYTVNYSIVNDECITFSYVDDFGTGIETTIYQLASSECLRVEEVYDGDNTGGGLLVPSGKDGEDNAGFLAGLGGTTWTSDFLESQSPAGGQSIYFVDDPETGDVSAFLTSENGDFGENDNAYSVCSRSDDIVEIVADYREDGDSIDIFIEKTNNAKVVKAYLFSDDTYITEQWTLFE